MNAPDFDTVYHAYWPNVVRWLGGCGVPARHVEDVAQEVFVRVCRSLPQYDPARPIEPWLFAITRRTAADYLALAYIRREHPAEDPVGLIDISQHSASRPDDELEERRCRQAAMEIVRTLPERLRRVFLLHLQGHSRREIAKALHLTEGAVCRRIEEAWELFESAARQRGVATGLVIVFLLDAAHAGYQALPTAGVFWASAAASCRKVVGEATREIRRNAIAQMGIAVPSFVLGVLAASLLPRWLAPFMPPVTPAIVIHSPASLATPEPEAEEHAEPDTLGPGPAQPGYVPALTVPATDRTAGVRAEKLLVERAQAALDSRDPAEALRLLGKHRQSFPQGWFSVERDELIRQAQKMLREKQG